MDLKEFIIQRLSVLPKEELVEALATHILKNESLRDEWRKTQTVTEAASGSQEKVVSIESADQQRRLLNG